MTNTILQGVGLSDKNPNKAAANARVLIQNGEASFELTDDQLSRHVLAFGASGFGKTFSLLQIAAQLLQSAADDEVFIFFDTKGDYLGRLGKPGDSIISSGDEATVYWNLFLDILADGSDADAVYDNAFELSTMMFYEKILKSTQPFFPLSARDVLVGMLYAFVEHSKVDAQFKEASLNNEALARFFRVRFNATSASEIFKRYEYTRGIIPCFSNGTTDMTPQSQGVIAETSNLTRSMFKTCFAKKGDFSIRRFIREKRARSLFVEFDMARSDTLKPIYSALFDIALKEALSRNLSHGRVYVFCDELSLLTSSLLSTGIHYGRGMGLSVIAGLQSVGQARQTYGESIGPSLLNSFGTVLGFNSTDPFSRELLSGRVGKNLRMESYSGAFGRRREQERISNTIEDYDIIMLRQGEAIVHAIGEVPYRFRFPFPGR